MNKKAIISMAMSAMLVISSAGTVYAAPGGGSSSSVSWSGATEITSATETSDQTYSSTTASQNAVLINTSGAVKLTNPTVTKSGGTSAGDDESFYGINSAVMCKGGGTTTITGAKITTKAAGANGVFSYGGNASTNATSGDGTKVVISDSTITTTGNGSGGIMTTGQGITEASNLTVSTSGGSSAAIRSDRGGGTVTVDGGTYETSGTGSPAVYATATITVSDATLTSTASQGIVNEGGNTVVLNDCVVNAANSTLGSQDYFKNGVFLYQSMSGDASDGASVFTMDGGTLNNTYGHVFHVTNTSAAITLSGVTINNSDSEGVFLSVCDDAWSGLDNDVTVNASNQTIDGKILVGSGDTAEINLSGTSVWTGTTSGEITAHRSSKTVSSSLGTVNVTLADSAKIVLSADTTLSSLTGTGTIDYNGHTLTVGSTSYTSGCPGVSTITEVGSSDDTGDDTSDDTGDDSGDDTGDDSSDDTEDDTEDDSDDTEKLVNSITAQNFIKSYSPNNRVFKLGATALYGTLSYSSSSSSVTVSSAGRVTVKAKFIGRAYITITATSDKCDTVTKKIRITVVPTRTALTSVTNTYAKTATVKWKANTIGSGYILQCSTSSSFANARTITASGSSTVKRNIGGLTKGKKYYIRIRTYKTVNGVKYYSSWGATKSVTIKK